MANDPKLILRLISANNCIDLAQVHISAIQCIIERKKYLKIALVSCELELLFITMHKNPKLQINVVSGRNNIKFLIMRVNHLMWTLCVYCNWGNSFIIESIGMRSVGERHGRKVLVWQMGVEQHANQPCHPKGATSIECFHIPCIISGEVSSYCSLLYARRV